YLYCYFKNNFHRKYSLRSIVFAILAVLAHLTLIHFLLSLFVLILITDFLYAEKQLSFLKKIVAVVKKNLQAEIILFVSLLYIIPVIYGLANAQAFFYGGKSGFWSDTVVSVFDRLLYEKNYPAVTKYVLSFCSVIIPLISAFVILKKALSKHYPQANLFFPSIFFLLVSCSLASVVQHYFLNVLLLTERTALYLLLLFSYLLVFLFNEFSASKKRYPYALFAIALFATVHFIISMNFKYVLEWKWDADVREMISDIETRKNEIPPGKFCTDIGMNLEFEAPINFYRYVNNLNWMNRASVSKKFSPLCDFYLYIESDLKKIDMDSFITLKTYPLFNSKLLKPKYRQMNYEILFSKKLDFESEADSITSLNNVSEKYSFSGKRSCFTDKKVIYSGGIKYPIPDPVTKSKGCMIAVKAWVLMENFNHADANLVISFDRDEKPYSWNASAIQDAVTEKNKWTEIYFSVFVPGEVQVGDVLSVYAYNNNTPVYIDDLEVRWLKANY
ncbi:MAG: hypothetical protein ACHQNT_12945, partial [Bacteroidia bacterium]